MKETIGKLSLMFLGIIMAVGGAEIAARLLDPPYEHRPNEMHYCDRWLGWQGQANLTTTLITDDYPHTIRRNTYGMHDTDHPVAKSPDVFRILMLGDSFVEALQVNEAETSHQILEDLLNARSTTTRFEVISGGIGAWGPAQALLYFQTEGRHFAPDLVLALWVPANDLLDSLPDYRLTYGGRNCYAPYFVLCEGQFDRQPWFSAPGVAPTWRHCSAPRKWLTSRLNHLYHYSRLYQQLEPLMTQSNHRLEYAHPYAPWLPAYQTDPALQYAYQLTAAIYTELAQQTAVPTAVVIVAPKQAIYSQLEPGLFQRSDLRHLDPTLPNQTFTELMTAQGLPVLDLQPAFVHTIRQTGQPLFWESDSHWNRAGNHLAAENIATWLIEQKLIR